MQSIRVLVVEDFEPFRELLCSILQKKKSQVMIDQASDGLEGVQKALELQPDLILLDLGLPKLNGAEAAKQMRKLAPGSKILCVSHESDPHVVQEMLQLGASGYVHKPRAGEELVSAVEAVLAGKQFVSHDVEDLDMEEENPADAGRLG